MTTQATDERQNELCVAILTEMQRCGIDVRFEQTKIPTVMTITRTWREDQVNFKHWSPWRECWFGISFRLADVEQLLAELKIVDDGDCIAARAIYDAAAKRIAQR